MKRVKSRIVWIHRPKRLTGRWCGLVPGALCPRYFIDSWNPSNPDERYALFVPESDEPYRTGSVEDCMMHARTHRRRYLHQLNGD